MLNLDLNKAFDRVEHIYLERALGKYGFRKRIINWIMLLYNNARSCVKINGVLPDAFPL